MKLHLLKDFGVYKRTLITNWENSATGGQSKYNEDELTRYLLQKHTQLYTINELKELFKYLITAHDECVVNNTYDYSPLQVYQAKKKIQFAESVMEKLSRLEL